jgi:hypothetical protein
VVEDFVLAFPDELGGGDVYFQQFISAGIYLQNPKIIIHEREPFHEPRPRVMLVIENLLIADFVAGSGVSIPEMIVPRYLRHRCCSIFAMGAIPSKAIYTLAIGLDGEDVVYAFRGMRKYLSSVSGVSGMSVCPCSDISFTTSYITELLSIYRVSMVSGVRDGFNIHERGIRLNAFLEKRWYSHLYIIV